jgi:hypothetical protein
MPDLNRFALENLDRSLKSVGVDLQQMGNNIREISSDVAYMRQDLDTALELLRSLAKQDKGR